MDQLEKVVLILRCTCRVFGQEQWLSLQVRHALEHPLSDYSIYIMQTRCIVCFVDSVALL
jgi:hypothetical protein